jgi:hypothetical protein
MSGGGDQDGSRLTFLSGGSAEKEGCTQARAVYESVARAAFCTNPLLPQPDAGKILTNLHGNDIDAKNLFER